VIHDRVIRRTTWQAVSLKPLQVILPWIGQVPELRSAGERIERTAFSLRTSTVSHLPPKASSGLAKVGEYLTGENQQFGRAAGEVGMPPFCPEP
jgi:hypothetical protein